MSTTTKAGPRARTLDKGWSRRFLTVPRDTRPACASPEAAVAHFYASWMRGDDAWKAVTPPEPTWSDTLRQKIARHQLGFPFDVVRLEGLRCSGSSCQFDVVLSHAKATSDGVHDQGQLQQVDDCWLVTRPPT